MAREGGGVVQDEQEEGGQQQEQLLGRTAVCWWFHFTDFLTALRYYVRQPYKTVTRQNSEI